ncbi:polyphosphate kinase 1 [Dichelobacter nodosus]|uniref:Polyphosphate kinase n=1 Tax=Dichelobacter nodosus (strain VCS1703A) TaxID=246195 RepID=A5EXN5_DICNV|nr:polyphosphate kinase 1 [Dichelobacter nodosus]ABQ13452.1 polyphosphate kinase [Dichelobacter nodosus VCS1703A]AXM45884.1 polyphosphate kinase 1 [Dichelobacter nodosus]KNZ39050.1 polyphosphate kinase [Dichelobacter nodosus]TGA64664.1 polyphosphate kinase 1 [Dichelobacter nodosus]
MTEQLPTSPKNTSTEKAPFIDIDTADPKDIYLNRELTWLAFNERVLFEARRKNVPLLERVKFLAIVNNNLDEFFMKRIGGLKQQVGAGLHHLSLDGRTPQKQIDDCYEKINKIQQDIENTWKQLESALKKENIEIVEFKQLSAEKQQEMRTYFLDNIYSLLTPQAMDPAHPFPFVSNLSLNLLIRMNYPETQKTSTARVKIPVGQGSKRFINVQIPNTLTFITLEDLIINNLDILFPEMEINQIDIFRVTRNAVTEKDEEKADDLLELIEVELRERRFAPIVRMEYKKGIDPKHKGMLASELHLEEDKDTFEVRNLMQMRDLFELTAIDREDLKLKPYHPVDHEGLVGEDNIFHAIRRAGNFLLQMPYESFTSSVERFIRDASRDPKVLGIKMTIYRTSSDSKIIDYLIEASRNGKQVTVVVEVKARFDESANIRWANHLEEAGIHVTYGIVGLKTHAKLIYVIRQDYDGLRRYAHIGTGNYHSGTARQYSDFGLLTADPAIGADLTELFNYLTTGYTPSRFYQKLLPAPKHMKSGLLDRIHREIKHAKAGKKSLIILKTNALEDKDIAYSLYQASQAGVKIELLVRDSCCIIAGVAGLSENITITSIVGRFLEHARVYYFYNGGDEEYFIGSADLMHRNLESRVEVIVPIENQKMRDMLQHFLETQLNDRENAWKMCNDGSYKRCVNPHRKIGSQEQFMQEATQRYKNASRLRHRKTKSIK